ncbi:MAG: WD40 repeat domain-containing protein [Bauldia sp.]|nr:WD40 repeat domain-containing protein [Bauldia sp.]
MPTLQPFPFGAFVVGAAFLDGRAAFALGDGTVRIVTGPAAEGVTVHTGPILATARTQDGRTLVTGGDDGKVMQVTAEGAVSERASHAGRWIDQVAAGPNGAIAFGAGKRAVVLLPDGKEKRFEHDRTVAGLAFAPKGFRLAVARYNGVSLWWVNADAPVTELAWNGAHMAVTFSPDGRYVVTAMQENALHGWRLPEADHLRMTGYPAKPRSLSWSPRGRYLATSGSESAVVWPFLTKDGPQGKAPLQLANRGEPLVTRVAFHPREDVLAVGFRDGVVGIAPIDGSRPQLLRQGDDSPVSALAWDDRGARLAFGTEAGDAGLIDLEG